MVPPGEVTFWRSVAGGKLGAMQQFAGAGDGFARELGREIGGQAGLDAGARQLFGEQENIGRA